jgi:arsenite/tail-anchored protein-transporting ATPase
MTQLPFFDVELVGVPALGYVGSQYLANNPNLNHLMMSVPKENENNKPPPKVIICGGKGGVGKTTTSASLAVTMAAQGHSVALISTDPAHSLGDAIDMNLQGGKLLDCPLIGVPSSNNAGSLSVLEVDPSAALGQFKGIVDQLIGGGGASASANRQGSELRNTLRELEQVFDTLPAGTDEVVALAQVINLVKKGGFDRIVLDTAPTGHTLRMLSTPGFLAELIDRLLSISQKINSNAAVKLLINTVARSATGGVGAGFGSSGSSSSNEDMEAAGAAAKSKLLSFQLQMYDLEDMFANPEQTEFLIVTVPTELAIRESVRLLNDLTFDAPDMPIKVRNVVVNQVLTDDGSDLQTFVSHVRDSQAASIRDLEQALLVGGSGGGGGARTTTLPVPQITKIPYLDTEPRGVFGLKILAEELVRADATTKA